MKPNHHTRGFTLVELLIVIVVVVILGALLIPAPPHGKAKAPRISCMNNLKQVAYAFRIWSGDHGDLLPTEISVTNGGAMEAVIAGNVAAMFQIMSNELNTPKILFCPADKKRIRATTFANANQFLTNGNLSYFVGLDTNTNSSGMFWSGDDNFLINGVAAKPGILSLKTNTPIAWSDARHEKNGNVGLADGSVQGFSSSALRTALANTGVETNRLAMP